MTVCLERIDLNKVAKSAEFSQLLLGVKNSPCEATFLGVDTELKNWLTTHAAARKVTKGRWRCTQNTCTHHRLQLVRLDYSEVVYNTIIDETFSFLILHIIEANA